MVLDRVREIVRELPRSDVVIETEEKLENVEQISNDAEVTATTESVTQLTSNVLEDYVLIGFPK